MQASPEGVWSVVATPPVLFVPTYEFTQKQNNLLGALAVRMRLVGAGLLVVAGLLLVIAVFGRVDGPALLSVLAVVLGFIGFWSMRSSAEIRSIVRTTGADIPHLMRALTELRKLYEVQLWVIGALALMVLLSVAARMTATAGHL